jgi:hypothetical protein
VRDTGPISLVEPKQSLIVQATYTLPVCLVDRSPVWFVQAYLPRRLHQISPHRQTPVSFPCQLLDNVHHLFAVRCHFAVFRFKNHFFGFTLGQSQVLLSELGQHGLVQLLGFHVAVDRQMRQY